MWKNLCLQWWWFWYGERGWYFRVKIKIMSGKFVMMSRASIVHDCRYKWMWNKNWVSFIKCGMWFNIIHHNLWIWNLCIPWCASSLQFTSSVLLTFHYVGVTYLAMCPTNCLLSSKFLWNPLLSFLGRSSLMKLVVNTLWLMLYKIPRLWKLSPTAITSAYSYHYVLREVNIHYY